MRCLCVAGLGGTGNGISPGHIPNELRRTCVLLGLRNFSLFTPHLVLLFLSLTHNWISKVKAIPGFGGSPGFVDISKIHQLLKFSAEA